MNRTRAIVIRRIPVALTLLLTGLLMGCAFVPFLGGSPTATIPPIPSTLVPTLTPSPVTPTPETVAEVVPEEEATPTPITGVLDAAYVRDMSIPDGTVMTPGQTFTKSWEVRNTGEVAWPAETELRRVEGPAMGPLESITINPRAVGETGEISIDLVAPTTPGTHRTYWQLCVGDACFGRRLFVEIRVQAR
jgi:hypothetical protein